MFRVIIAGGQDFDDYSLLEQTVDRFLYGRESDVMILCGKTPGADALGERYARIRGYALQYYPTDWQQHGRKPPPICNREAAENADALVAFWDGRSRGTEQMIEIAMGRHMEVLIEGYEKEGREDRA